MILYFVISLRWFTPDVLLLCYFNFHSALYRQKMPVRKHGSRWQNWSRMGHEVPKSKILRDHSRCRVTVLFERECESPIPLRDRPQEAWMLGWHSARSGRSVTDNLCFELSFKFQFNWSVGLSSLFAVCKYLLTWQAASSIQSLLMASMLVIRYHHCRFRDILPTMWGRDGYLE